MDCRKCRRYGTCRRLCDTAEQWVKDQERGYELKYGREVPFATRYSGPDPLEKIHVGEVWKSGRWMDWNKLVGIPKLSSDVVNLHFQLGLADHEIALRLQIPVEVVTTAAKSFVSAQKDRVCRKPDITERANARRAEKAERIQEMINAFTEKEDASATRDRTYFFMAAGIFETIKHDKAMMLRAEEVMAGTEKSYYEKLDEIWDFVEPRYPELNTNAVWAANVFEVYQAERGRKWRKAWQEV